MPRDDSLTPRDLVEKLDVLVVACDKCGRSGRPMRRAPAGRRAMLKPAPPGRVEHVVIPAQRSDVA
jgi:hypothetical protein